MEKVLQQLSEIESSVASIKEDIQKFEKGNDAAATRARKASKSLANLAIDFRKTIQDERDSRK